jgi:hypothetical protein
MDDRLLADIGLRRREIRRVPGGGHVSLLVARPLISGCLPDTRRSPYVSVTALVTLAIRQKLIATCQIPW